MSVMVLNNMKNNVIAPITIASDTPERFFCRMFSNTPNHIDHVTNLILKLSQSTKEFLRIENWGMDNYLTCLSKENKFRRA